MSSETEKLLDDLKSDSQTKYLKENCPSLFHDDGTPSISYNKILSSGDNIIIPDSSKYYKIVENGNNYVNELLDEEENYLKEKYGESLYDYFKTKREEYIDTKINSVCNNIVGSNSVTYDSSILTNMSDSYGELLNTYNEVMNNKSNKVELDKLNSRKFYYRSSAIEDANKIDVIITIVYYVILILTIIYLAVKGRINIKKNILYYILLILLPLALFRIYVFAASKYKILGDSISNYGPKKAFLNQS
tara:strand:+ start:4645 stop:5385 length:741 start_codon:yes stop_codon:yes gene_type:complete